WKYVQRQLSEPRSNVGIGQCFDGCSVELGDDVVMRSCRRKEAKPSSRVETRKSCLRSSRNIRRYRKTALGGNRVGLERALSHIWQRRPSGEQRQVDSPLRQVLNGGTGAAVGHQSEMRAGFPLKEHAANVRSRAGDRRGCLVGIRLKPSDKFPQIVPWRGFANCD